MTSHGPEEGEAAAAVAAEGLLADLLREVVHELNGRASALSGIAQLWGAGSEVVDPGHLEDEVERVAGIAERVGLLIPPRSGGGATLVDPRTVLEEAATLLGMLAEADGVRPPDVLAEGDIPPVRGEPWALRMAVVRGLSGAVRTRAREGSGSTLLLRLVEQPHGGEAPGVVEAGVAEVPSARVRLGPAV
jgi:hypothetical protein